jgi:threonine/homoserine/homoserine lactone efflux protein
MDTIMMDLLLPLFTFAVVTSVTPGPNNVMLTASGANFGFRRTLPHMLGIAVGFPVMVVAIGWGLGEIFRSFPALHEVLKYAGAAYLLFLAWKIATAGRAGTAEARGRPMTFLQAAAFQWVNPKGWMMAISAITAYTTVGGNPFVETLVIAAIFALVTMPCIGLWALFGVGIGRLLQSDTWLRAFNLLMAALLVASLVPLFL